VFLRAGVSGLRAIGEVEKVSRLYETAPVGGPEQGPYLNAVVLIDSDLEPQGLLAELNRVETEQQRKRKERWGARTLDLDIISAEGLAIADPDLQIPHTRAADREFVLRPLVDVWPQAPLSDGNTARGALDSCDDQGVDLVAGKWVDDESGWTGRLFVGFQMLWFIAIALALAWDGSLPDGSGDVFRIIGGLLAIFGAALAFISSRRLGPALTAVPEPTDEGQLIQTGPYRLVRHPIYGGVVLFILGTSMILDSISGALLSVGLVPFFYFKSQYEERVLRIRYSDYRAYREVVTRRFFPFVF
jgi:2-amino-4-hydroxy-6-hydroxymethyldihydropteridine diphosphokinase